MSEFNGTPHIRAKKGEIAKVVLMPGDPLRAKYVAENFLENPHQFNDIRGMLGYTGLYKGKEVSVMGHGMGIPSIGIYSYELYKFYDVETIIRFGTSGGMAEGMNLFDVVIVEAAYSPSTYAKDAFGFTEDLQLPSKEIVEALEASAKKLGKDYVKGIVESGDCFYSQIEENPPYDLVAGEMESFGLFANARALGKKAGCILTVSDLIGATVQTTPEQRQTAFTDMMLVALDTAINL